MSGDVDGVDIVDFVDDSRQAHQIETVNVHNVHVVHHVTNLHRPIRRFSHQLIFRHSSSPTANSSSTSAGSFGLGTVK